MGGLAPRARPPAGCRHAVGVVFDCDGTLVDSEPRSAEAWRRTVAPYGYRITDEDLAAVTGIPYVRTHAYLAERVQLPDADALWPRLSKELFALIDAQLEPFEDALEAL